MSFTRDYSIVLPIDHTLNAAWPGNDRNIKQDVQDRLADIVSGFNAGETVKGILNLPFIAGSNPSTVTDQIQLFAKVVSTKTELFIKDEDGNVFQITDTGKLNAVNLTGDQSIASGVKTFVVSPIVPTPTTDFQASTKKYVDDTVKGVPYLKYSNTQSSGAGGGNSTSGSWQTYPLNTEDRDTGGIASLSSNQIVLPAGTYKARGAITFLNNVGGVVFSAQCRLYNVSDSAIIANGLDVYSDSGSTTKITMPSSFADQFTIAGTKTIAIQYQVNVSVTNGLGAAVSFGSEVYGFIELEKIG